MSDRIEWADVAYNGPATIVQPAEPEPTQPTVCDYCGECDECRDYDDALAEWNSEPDSAADELNEYEVAVVLAGTAWHGTPTQVRLTLARALADLDALYPPTSTALAALAETWTATAAELAVDGDYDNTADEVNDAMADVYRECVAAVAHLLP